MQPLETARNRRLALAALFLGAAGIGFAPIFVRLSPVGPSATAFYRLLFALPLLWAGAGLEIARAPRSANESAPANARWRSPLSICTLAGVFFAADLAFWHWSVKLTTVANSTLLTNCAPFFVMLGARFLFSEKITLYLIAGLVVASCGACLLVGVSLQLSPRHLLGDCLAMVTAGFYGGYLLTVKYVRLRWTTTRTLAWSGLVSCVLLLIIARVSRESIWVDTRHGWLLLLGLAWISHVGGQGLIAYALAHLPAGFSSVGLLFQPVVAAILAWLILSERLSATQLLGGAIVLSGIALAGRKR